MNYKKLKNFVACALFGILSAQIAFSKNSEALSQDASANPTKIQTDKRVIAIGDLHGDYVNTIKILHAAGILDQKLNWIANDTIVIQMGDVLDRGTQEEDILNLFELLPLKAKEHNSEFYMIHGNHEIMNFAQDFRYAPKGSFPNRHQDFQLGGRIEKKYPKIV